MPLPGSKTLRRGALAAGGVVAAVALAGVPTATADFAIPACGGSAVTGAGSSFQTAAQAAFETVYLQAAPTGCGGAPGVTYNPSSSGNGRAALGEQGTLVSGSPNGSGARDASIRFAGTDQAPTALQRSQIEKGPVDANKQDVTSADDGKVNVIPVAIGAIAIIVHLPNGCDYNQNTPTLIRDRPVMTNANLERLWDGDPSFQTWGKVFPWLSGKADCDKQIHRVVRQESSGTSFALKQFLNEINPAAGWNAASQANTVWPNSDTDAVTLANAASGSGERNTVRDTDSSIGYVDLATARGDNGTFYWQNASDETFWLPIARKASTTQFDEPTSDANGYKDPTTNAAPNANTVAPGANCFNATPKTALPADASSDWSNVDYTYSDNAYGPCTLTYDLVFDDDSSVYCNSPAEESQARTLKDYFTRGVVSAAGQNSLVNAYYDRLPTDALAKAQAAVDSLGWKKNGSSGRPCPGSASPTPTPTATPSTTPAPPAPPSNKFAITSARSVTSGTSAAVRLSLQLPGAGKLSIKGTAKPKKGKSVTLSTKSASATKAGTQTITISLSSKAKSALKKNKTLSVKLTITFTPNGGTAATQSKTVTVKQPKAKKKKSKK